jgi:hypothetical protein
LDVGQNLKKDQDELDDGNDDDDKSDDDNDDGRGDPRLNLRMRSGQDGLERRACSAQLSVKTDKKCTVTRCSRKSHVGPDGCPNEQCRTHCQAQVKANWRAATERGEIFDAASLGCNRHKLSKPDQAELQSLQSLQQT